MITDLDYVHEIVSAHSLDSLAGVRLHYPTVLFVNGLTKDNMKQTLNHNLSKRNVMHLIVSSTQIKHICVQTPTVRSLFIARP